MKKEPYCYILVATTDNGVGIEFVENWISEVTDVSFISAYDKIITVEHESDLDAIEDELDDSGASWICTLKDLVLLFNDNSLYDEFARNCPGYACTSRVATKRDRRLYKL